MDVSLRRAHMFRVDMAGRHDWMMQQRRRRGGGLVALVRERRPELD